MLNMAPLAPFAINGNSHPVEDLFSAFDPALLDKPFDGRFLCKVLGCESTFTRLGDRNRHVESMHNKALHFCLVPGCEKNLRRGGKGYTRKDKLQEHMQKKHAGLAMA
jgi:hypothetical protein